MTPNPKSFRNFLAAPLVIFLFLAMTGIITWKIQGDPFMLITFLYIGIFTAGGMVLFIVLPKKKKAWGRKVSFFMVGGLLLLIGMGLTGRINVQLEGFFFYILAGFYAGTMSHYLVAKVIGPIVMHRSWCGWGCWTMMVLDMLPYKKGSGWVPGQ
ncbi:MAG: hypothetical protein SCH39_13070 [Methanosarcinales archaeon]|nr:hypothetical protein [Methanosarcinales archaeon]